jgi:hypothetical protein
MVESMLETVVILSDVVVEVKCRECLKRQESSLQLIHPLAWSAWIGWLFRHRD